MQFFEILFFILVLALFYFLGYQLKLYFDKKGYTEDDGLGTVGGSLLALFAFFLGFTFSISSSKIEQVRLSSVREGNAIGTALLRCDLYDDASREQLRALFKNYINERLLFFKQYDLNDTEWSNEIDLANQESDKIWDFVIDKAKTGQYDSQSRLMIPALNEMFDSSTSRNADIKATLPPVIIFTLYFLSVCSCFIVGFSLKSKILTNVIGAVYLIIIALTVTLIIDAGNPTKGLINIKRSNQVIEQIYESLE